MTDNPLLVPSSLPNKVPPFDKIREEHYLPALKSAIEEARKNIEDIKDDPAEPTFENTIVALEGASETLGIVTSVFYNQLSVNGSDSMHELAEKIGPISSNFSNDILHDEKLFARIKAVHDKIDNLGFTPEQYTLTDETYKGFVRGGALLNEAGKNRLREISERLSVLGPTFMNNVKKATEQFELVIEDEGDLSGIPETAIEAARHEAEEKGYKDKWLFTLDAPSYMPLMQYADNRDIREKVWRAFTARAWQDDFDNSENVLEIVRLRHEKAKLLGFETFADFVLEKRMAEKKDTVWAFLEKLKSAYKPAAQKDLARLKDFAGGVDLNPWDVGYYSEKLKESLFHFSSEELRPYFPLDNVLKGMFGHFSKLFGLRFEKSDAYPLWHEDAQAYELFNEKDGSFVGTLFADFHPRTGKKNGAWETGYRDQGLFRGNIERPVVSIACNFPKATPTKPSLLSHNDVTTLFHEMGHALHALLSDVTYASVSGTNVLWDFVELPSQLQENWCYEKETLDMFAAHYETGEKIPEELIRKLRDSKNFMVGWMGLTQVRYATLDMAWYGQDTSDIHDVAAFEDAATADLSLFPRLSGPMSTGFSHIFAGGYGAGYYSYKWAEVLDADTFEMFLERGLYDRPTADAYRTKVLAKGGSEHPSVLYKRFRGRDADPDALLRREGLLADGEQRTTDG